MALARTIKELRVWQNAMDLAMRVFEVTRPFPPEERGSLTDPVLRAARSIPMSIADGWRRRRYRGAFIAKLSDAESQATQVQTSVELALRCGYCAQDAATALDAQCEEILAQVGAMIDDADRWCPRSGRGRDRIRPRSDDRNQGPAGSYPSSASSGESRFEGESSEFLADESAEFREGDAAR